MYVPVALIALYIMYETEYMQCLLFTEIAKPAYAKKKGVLSICLSNHLGGLVHGGRVLHALHNGPQILVISHFTPVKEDSAQPLFLFCVSLARRTCWLAVQDALHISLNLILLSPQVTQKKEEARVRLSDQDPEPPMPCLKAVRAPRLVVFH